MRFFAKFIVLAIFFPTVVEAQTVVSGKVTESATGTPIPFANVVFSGTQDGAITDFEGNFTASTTASVDSIEVRYIGFIKRVKALRPGENQIINFQLDEDVQTLGEVVVFAGENPSWPIMREVVAHKKANDKRSLTAYDYESYSKMEFDVDNISNFIQKWKLVKTVQGVLDSIQTIAGEDGMPVLPIFMSEAISRYYYRANPTLNRENIIKTKVSGVGVTDGTLISQVIGSTFQEYNFYQNWLNLITKQFVSPIADSWKLYYNFYLEDSLTIGDDFCYRIDFYPKREQDLAFTGSMWITKADYAIRRIDATVPKEVNLNYIEKIKIQQDLMKTSSGPWLPEKTRVVVDVSQVTKQTAGMIGKFYVSTKDHRVNNPMPNEFYLNPVTMEEDVQDFDDGYWNEVRHDTLTSTEKNVFLMIDTLKKIPAVKTYIDVASFLITGYYKVGPIDLGPYPTFFGRNNVEGVRFGFGARTNKDFSRDWTIGGYLGYGLKDKELKYKVYVDRILDRSPWTNIKLEHQKELEQIWLLNEQIEPNSLFYSLSRFGSLTQPFFINKYRLSLFRQLNVGFSAEASYKYESFDPQFDFNYYVNEPGEETASNYTVSEATLSMRYAKDEVFVINDNQRLSLGTVKWPAFNLDYTYGMRGFLNSDFEYHKIRLGVEKKQKMGFLGVANVSLTGGYIYGDLPYPLLYNAIGNETFFYVDFAYNLMNYFEFSTDKYLDFRYRHSFEGFILNTIPLMKKLKWRLIASANMLYGGLAASNIDQVQYELDEGGEPILPFNQFDKRPYVELGYGVENILKVFSVEAFHRMTYLDRPDVSRFGLKFSIKIVL